MVIKGTDDQRLRTQRKTYISRTFGVYKVVKSQIDTYILNIETLGYYIGEEMTAGKRGVG